MLAGPAKGLNFRVFDSAPMRNGAVNVPEQALRRRLGTSGLAGIVQAIPNPAVHQTEGESEVPM